MNALKKMICAGFVASTVFCHPLYAADARAVALGGLALTYGNGVAGTLANPASLMNQKRRSQGLHLHLGTAVDFRDPGRFFEFAIDNNDLVDDISDNIDILTNSTLACAGQNLSLETVCLTNTQELGANFARVTEIANSISQQPVELLADAQSGIGYTHSRIPFAIHLNFTVSTTGEFGASQNDLDYLNLLTDALIDGQLTIGDITESALQGVQILSVNPNFSGSVNVVQPQDLLTSQLGATLIYRTQFGISFGHSFNVAGRTLDVGITPKISSLSISRTSGVIAADFDASTPSLFEDFLDAETTSTSFTFDLGATYAVSDQLALSSVVRNLIPESVTSSFDSFTIDTTPQVLVSAAYQFRNIGIHANAALNTAERDGVITQPFALGAEFGQGNYSLRAGVSFDNGRTADEAAVTLGFGLGPLQLGARLSSLNALQAGAQLSYTFR